MSLRISYPLFFSLMIFSASCAKEDNPGQEPGQGAGPGEEQKVEVLIESPADGAKINTLSSLEIKGAATVSAGSVSEVVLTVGGTVIESVTSVPFSYTFDFPEDYTEKELTVSLEVKGDKGVSSSSSVTVETLKVTGGEMTDSRDGNVYRTVTLGTQTWMAENLAYLPGKQDTDISWTEPKYYVWADYDLESESSVQQELARAAVETYGIIYNWWAAMDGDAASDGNSAVQGICPEGWHLPTVSEWNTLSDYLGSNGFASDAGDTRSISKSMATPMENMWLLDPYEEEIPAPTWPAIDPQNNNLSGFNAMPVGFRACAVSEGYPDVWMQSAYSAGWWCSTVSSNIEGLVHATRMYSNDPYFWTGTDFNPGVGLPVRCIKD